MSEGTLQPEVDKVSACDFEVECTTSIKSGMHRTSLKISDFPKVSLLRGLFASVALVSVEAEARQNTTIGEEKHELKPGGHIFLAIIPTMRDTDSASGGSNAIVGNVPNKQTFPLSAHEQMNEVFKFRLDGFELDLAQDPRRGAGPVAWIGNSGVTSADSVHICTVTWRIKVRCEGTTSLW